MRIAVLGAGVVGLTTAWALAEAGCDVVVVDRQAGPGMEASRGNGGQLSYGFVAPLASPATLRRLPAMLLDRNGPLRVKPTLDPAFLRWGAAFLIACRDGAVRATIAAQLRLGALSREELGRLSSSLDLDFGLLTAGKLVLYRKEASFGAAREQAPAWRAQGVEQQVLTARECLDLEPALRIKPSALAGGIYNASEQVGDCGAFCDGLAEHLRRRNNVAWRMGSSAVPVVDGGRLRAVAVDGREVEAETFVLALGSGAARFARRAGVRLPICPMKGYSLTVRLRGDPAALRHSVTDMDGKVVFAPLASDGETLVRVAGIADLVGYDRRIDPARIAAVHRGADDVLDVDWRSDPLPWAGLRPATPDSRPIIGWSPLPGLFLNTGHGALGWTLACGSARLTADLLLEREPTVASGPFALHRRAA